MNRKVKHHSLYFPASWEHVESTGPSGFTTRIVHRLKDGTLRVWTSRRHRKGCGLQVRSSADEAAAVAVPARRNPWLTFWAPGRLTWWIALGFFVGAALFAAGSFPSLFPSLVGPLAENVFLINTIYFVGSIFFTSAAYMQLLEAINTSNHVGFESGDPPRRFEWFAWQPRRLGYLASLIQLIGTILFNVNTFDAFLPGLGWVEEDLLIWGPDIVGSICFLISSYLAFMEVCHGHWRFRPRSVSWWIVLINLLGSVGFMISAIYAIALPGPPDAMALWIVNFFTFQGALCFLAGSYLMLPEMFSE